MKNQVVEFYNEWIKLKELMRSGWVQRHVAVDRTESVADHVFSCTLLGWTIIEQEKLDIDLLKVMKILLVHEVGEIYIGDITPQDNVSREEKYRREFEAVQNLSKQVEMPNLLELWLEFEKMETKEAIFAKKMDRLECVMQAKSYAERTGNSALFEEFYHHAEKEIEEFKRYCLD